MKIKLIIFTIISFYFLNFSVVQADLITNLRPKVEEMKNEQGAAFFNENLGDYISKILHVVLIIGAIMCFMYMILGGISWLTSSGDKQKVEDARNKITSSIVGLAILASVFALWTLIVTFFGLDKTDLLKIDKGGGVSSCMTNCLRSYIGPDNPIRYCKYQCGE